jgi:ferrochelatase
VSKETGILVMAYGTPKNLDDVEPYYTHIRRGSPPPPELLDELKGRYEAIGGHSPLLEITEQQRLGLEERLGHKTYLGQKHASPFIEDAVEAMAGDGVERAVGIVLAPHYSSGSIGQYRNKAEAAAQKLGWTGTLDVVESWATEPGYVSWLAEKVTEQIDSLPEELRAEAIVVFSAHSLPLRVVEGGDPYPDELRATAEAVAKAASLEHWMIGWQSAGRTADPWLGPDILDVMRSLHQDGVGAVVISPCGFVSDHLEVLYDIDIEAQGLARDLGMELRRTPSPNADPEFLDAVASAVRKLL